MTTLTLRTVLNDNTFSSPELSNFIGEEVEIVVKKIRKKRKKSFDQVVAEIQELVRKHNPDNRELSTELIQERRREAMNE
ncbi:MAG: hypothetical protein V1779_17525 [bacterium]